MEQAAIRLPFLHDSAFVRGLMDHDNRPGEARDFSLDSVTDGLVFRYVVPEHVCAVDGLKANNEVRRHALACAGCELALLIQRKQPQERKSRADSSNASIFCLRRVPCL